MLTVLLRFINLAFTLYEFAIIARALLPWFRVDPYHPVMRFLIQITEPLLAPIRRNLPAMGGLDFSPMVALLILWAVELLLQRVVLMLPL
ncbi:MAG: YggT family protein [Anaerolineae bacterium]|jgi:YggT family protein